MKKVWVYFNVRTRTFSVRCDGKVIDHTDHVVLCDARFRVSEAGRQRVLETGHKNVHAYIVGYLCENMHGLVTDSHARYNPQNCENFVDCYTGQPVRSAPFVEISVKDGKPVIGYTL